MDIATLITSLIGNNENTLTITLITIFIEILFYFTASLFGLIFRNIIGNLKFKPLKDFGFAIATTVILFIIGNYIKAFIPDDRLFFGISAVIAAYLPHIFTAPKKGSIFVKIVAVFSEKWAKVLEEVHKKNEEPYDWKRQGNRRKNNIVSQNRREDDKEKLEKELISLETEINKIELPPIKDEDKEDFDSEKSLKELNELISSF